MAESKIPCPAPLIDWGYITEGTIPPSNGENLQTTSLHVNFHKAFSGAPFVMAVVQSNNKGWGSNVFYVSRVTNQDVEGCDIVVGNLSNSDIVLSDARCVKWIAIGF